MIGYINTYPDFKSMPGMYVQTTSPEDMCTSENMNYIQYHQMPLSDAPIPFDTCLPNVDEGNSFIYSADSCATSGQVSLFMYSDTTCSTFAEMYTMFDNNCMSDDGDDDDADDDDDYELVDVIENDFCT